MKKIVHPHQKCPINNKIEITSPKCQRCENYVKHVMICDEHGRIEHYQMDCKVLEKNETL